MIRFTTDETGPLDRSCGRVQIIGGDLFYSPNSRRDVHLPQVYDSFPVRDCLRDDFSEFRQPLWWQPGCPYLAFVPLRPVFAGVPFQDLFHISYFPRLQYGSFMLDPQIILGWARLQKNIIDAVELLLARESVPPINWIVSTSLGCGDIFRRVRDLRASYARSKGWFTLFMGAFSYAIAISLSHKQQHNCEGVMPYWFSFLSQRGNYSQIWLSGIMSSIVANFHPSIPRVGVFVQVFQRNRDQFSIDWLCALGIPVWYPWGAQEVQASIGDARLARFAPLPHQLQESSTFLTKNPTELHGSEEPQTQGFDCK
jgi:hypothetical protein